ncbi:hypothetical protein BC937DRAFT_87816 [Endogone sp. FLAS-F59071]|nr:hypothetical protein BC937DRAFT_87816 [Endogone sp. FLAS-F59071]|eukprot:RUS12465.1 hypothetical protein BC937DRAFT_87816 [Endogone sp. FLAS-F59071]
MRRHGLLPIYPIIHLPFLNPVEPTSPDDILGHATVRKALYPRTKVATGEHIQNRVIFNTSRRMRSISAR